MKKLKIFLSMNWKMKKILIESLFYLGWARILKRISFSKVAPNLGNLNEGNNFFPKYK